mgnify:CR=1 FL=1
MWQLDGTDYRVDNPRDAIYPGTFIPDVPPHDPNSPSEVWRAENAVLRQLGEYGEVEQREKLRGIVLSADLLLCIAPAKFAKKCLVSAAARGGVPAQLEMGIACERARLAQLRLPKSTSLHRPTQADVDSTLFKAIVGLEEYTAGGKLKGTIFDVTKDGLREIKSGSSVIGSRSYQLRLQTYYSVRNKLPFTLDTTRPVSPAVEEWLKSWGAKVEYAK